MSIAGLIVAGGQGRRIGGGKPLLPFRGAMLLDAVIARARPQVDSLALNIPETDSALYQRFALPLLIDAVPGFRGPLSGVVAGLMALPPGTDWLASFPCDTPFLPRDLVARLAASRAGERPVFSQAGEEIHALCALWPRAALGKLRAGVEAGTLASVRRALAALEAIPVPMPAGDPGFFNINTREDLAEAERMAAAGA